MYTSPLPTSRSLQLYKHVSSVLCRSRSEDRSLHCCIGNVENATVSRPFVFPILHLLYIRIHARRVCGHVTSVESAEARRISNFRACTRAFAVFLCEHRCASLRRCEEYRVRHPLGDLTVNLDRPFFENHDHRRKAVDRSIRFDFRLI